MQGNFWSEEGFSFKYKSAFVYTSVCMADLKSR